MVHNYNRLSFCTWNINGLYNKTIGDKSKSDDFTKVIKKHDFIAITETWTEDIKNIPNYSSFSTVPQKKLQNRFKNIWTEIRWYLLLL